MYAGRSAERVVEQWQSSIQADVEAGADSLLQSGGGHFGAPNVVALYALQLMARERDDPALPVVVGGGSGAHWPCALFAPRAFQARGAQQRPGAPAPAVFYGGDDPAMGMACLATWVDGLTISPYVRRPQDHYLYAPLLLPRTHLGANQTWEMLPLTVIDPPVSAVPGSVSVSASGMNTGGFAQMQTHSSARELVSESSADWIAWAVLILTLFLPLLALVL